MTDYKTVFQLAEDKGYKLQVCKSFFGGDLPYMELCLIQKWLRDEHKMAVLISIPFDVYWRYAIDGINGNGYYSDSSYKEKKDFVTYEEALLEGINEALKLLP